MEDLKGLKYHIVKNYQGQLHDDTLTFHQILKEMYVDKDMSMNDIAKELHIGVGSVHRFIKQEGLVKELKWK